MSRTKQSKKSILKKGIIDNNPTFVMLLGMCPTLATTNTFAGALAMGISVVIVLVLTNAVISLFRKIVPAQIRIPMYITLIATVVTIIEYFLQIYFIELYDSIGIYIALIAVNCIILGRAEAFAAKNNVGDSIVDGLGTGLGFLFGLSILAFFRELIGTGGIDLLKINIMSSENAISIFAQNPGAFLTLGIIVAIRQYQVIKKKKTKELQGDYENVNR